MRGKAVGIELIIMTGLLIVVIAIVLLDLVKVRQISERSEAITRATIKAQNMMEYCKAKPKEIDQGLIRFGGQKEENGYIFYFKDDWQKTNDKNVATFSMQVNLKEMIYESGKLKWITIILSQEEGGVILSLVGNAICESK